MEEERVEGRREVETSVPSFWRSQRTENSVLMSVSVIMDKTCLEEQKCGSVQDNSPFAPSSSLWLSLTLRLSLFLLLFLSLPPPQHFFKIMQLTAQSTMLSFSLILYPVIMECCGTSSCFRCMLPITFVGARVPQQDCTCVCVSKDKFYVLFHKLQLPLPASRVYYSQSLC